MRLLALDPGKRSGVAYVDSSDLETYRSYILPWRQAMDYVVDAVLSGKVDRAVVEDFRISQRTVTQGKDHYGATGGIGVIEWACYRAQVPCERQAPGDAKGFADDDKLRRMGWYTPTTHGDHANDASRHLLLGLVRHKAIELSRLAG